MGEELLLFEFDDMSTVISATRRPEKVSWLSLPVSIISAEDIHYSGLTSIPDVLQFTPGVDVLQIDRDHFVVGVRGLHEVYSDRLKTLIDGRSADNIMTGGANLMRLPVPMEDIARIEIVRGPAGGVWGANAFTGVINVITKDPKDCLGLFMSTTVNHFGDSYSHVRYARQDGRLGWLASLVYDDRESSDDAISGDSFLSHDFSRSFRFHSKAVYDIERAAKLSFGFANTHLTSGAMPNSTPTSENKAVDLIRTYLRIDRTDGDVTGYLQWYGNVGHIKESAPMRYTTVENVLEGQLDFHLSPRHVVSTGGSASWMFIDTRNPNKPGYVSVIGEPHNEALVGLFFMDRYKLTDRLELEGQIRGDHYTGTRSDWAARLSAMYALDEAKQHVVRVSAAKAFRTPFVTLRKTVQQFGYVPAGTFGPGSPATYMSQILQPRSSLENEETWALELGYTGQITEMLAVRGNAYYQHFCDLIGFDQPADPLGYGRRFFYPENIADADSYGGELEVELKTDNWKLTGWYAYNDFRTEKPDQDIRAYLPADHKMGVTGRLFLPHDWTLNANYRYKTSTSSAHVETTTDSPPSHRFDLTIAKAFDGGNGELMIGVSDLFNRNVEGVSAIDESGGHDTPGRTYFVRLQWKF